MRKKSTLSLNSTQVRKSGGYLKISNAIWAAIFMLTIIISGCKKDTYQGEISGVCPAVTTDPLDKAVDVALGKIITITFNTNMSAATINKNTFIIKQGATLVPGTVAPTANGAVFTFTPDVALSPFVVYTGTVTTGATDTLRTALVSDYVWTFTTIPLVTLTSAPAAGGTTTGSGTFAQGSIASVNATPNTGFVFTNWTENTTVVSTSSSYQFTVAGNRTLVANFTAVVVGNFAVVLSAAPVAGGTTGGAGSFGAGSTVTTTATPAAGYTFVNWTENGTAVSTSSSYQFTLTGNRTLVANFKVIPASQVALVLSSSPVAGGSTNGSGAYTAGTSVTATATPNTGYTFTSWTENGTVVSNSAAYTFALNANRTLVANFTINVYALALSANPAAGGVVTGAGSFNAGSTATAMAAPNTGYTFVNWTENGTAVSANATYAFVMSGNRTLVANFINTTFTLTVTAVNGTVVKNPNQATYNSGSTVQLTATPNLGYTFTSWSVDASGSTNPLTVTMNANKNITANFTLTPAVGPTLANLGGAGNFTILTQAGITDVPTSAITGNIGASPISGASLVIGCPEVNGTIYTIDGAGQTSACAVTNKNLVDIAVADMGTAYTTDYGLTTPAPVNEQSSGVLNGETLTPGIYKWSSNVGITTGITLKGGPNDTWVFQIAGNLTVNNSAIITLTGGAQAKNIVWVVAGATVALGTNVDFSGIILSKNLISLNTGAKVTGRLLSQKAVTLIKNIVVNP